MAFNLIEKIADHLDFCGFGKMATIDCDGDIFYGHMPDSPDEAICVFSSDSQYGGSDEAARIQIYVRAKTTKRAYEWSQEICEGLIGFDGYLCGDGAHVKIEPINTSVGLGTDEKNREIYSSNFYLHYCNA